MTQPCRRGMEGLPTFRHGNQLIVLPSIPIDHPYRHSLKSCEVPSRVWNDVQGITNPKLPHGNRQPYFEVWKWCHGSRLPNFYVWKWCHGSRQPNSYDQNWDHGGSDTTCSWSWKSRSEIDNSKEGFGNRQPNFWHKNEVLEIAIPIFTPLNEVLEVAIQVFTSQLTNLEVVRKTTSTSIPKPEYDGTTFQPTSKQLLRMPKWTPTKGSQVDFDLSWGQFAMRKGASNHPPGWGYATTGWSSLSESILWILKHTS